MRIKTLPLLLLCAITALAAEQTGGDPATVVSADQFAKWDKQHSRATFDMLRDEDPRPQSLNKQLLKKKLVATAAALDLDGKNISITGYMVPVDLDVKGVSMFVLAQHLDQCCFGVVGQPNDLVLVIMGKKTVFSKSDPVTVFGKFHVNDITADEFGAQSLYQMDGAAVAVHTAAFDKAIGLNRP